MAGHYHGLLRIMRPFPRNEGSGIFLMAIGERKPAYQPNQQYTTNNFFFGGGGRNGVI